MIKMSRSLLCIWILSVCIHAGTAQSVYPVTDSGGLGRVFDGIGGLSGGGATSKLLINYPKPMRDEILDFLFKPNFGASLQVLKVEIGGDSQSTDGTEASHMHNSWDENFHRGYEWWLMTEAKKRNPNIKLYGLPWGFPGWLGDGTTDNPFKNSTQLAEYILKWILGAQRVYGLTIDLVGIWNEHTYDTGYIKTLRKVLDQNGCSHTRIVGADKKWEIADFVLKDPDLANAVDYLGCHYPGTMSDDAAMKTGKQLWASEDYSTFNDQVGGGCWARILNQNYVNGFMTSTISWNLIASYYNPLPWFRTGLMTAVEPWSGHYEVETPIWVSAHTTQFTEVGWRYLGHGSGVGHLEGGGSYVTLVSPDLQQLTLVLETISHNHSICVRPRLPPYTVRPQTATFTLGGNFSHITELNVWVSKLDPENGEPSMFQQGPPIMVNSGKFTVDLGVDEVHTLTTVTTGRKGEYPTPPPSQPFPLPYEDDFQGYEDSQEPFNLAPQSGSFEVVETSPSVKVMRQTVLQHPVSWCTEAEDGNAALNVAGNFNWTDIEVQVDFGLNTTANSSSGAFLGARIQGGGCRNTSTAVGVFFSILTPTNSYCLSLDIERKNVIEKGKVPFPMLQWSRATLKVQGGMVEASYNGSLLVSALLPAEVPKNGFAGLGTTSWGIADFDNFAIIPAVTRAKK